ncbi:phosphotransferase [Mycoplasmatota bacterium WC44]
MKNYFNYDVLPNEIRKFIENQRLEEVSIGESLSQVLYIPNKNAYLKISPNIISFTPENEYKIYNWLKGKLPVPEVLIYRKTNKFHYMVLSEVKGEDISEAIELDDNERVKLFARGLRMIHDIDISDCPIEYSTDSVISKIKYCLYNDIYGARVNIERTFEKLEEYRKNAPTYEPVLIHGDYAMVNVLAKDNKISGFIDMGEAGIYCKYRDIVHAVDNLGYWGYGHQDYIELFFKEYGLSEPDQEMLRYFEELDYD